MAKRYYLSDIIGDGSVDNPYRVAASEFSGIRAVADIPTDSAGRPIHRQALCLVAASDHGRIAAAPGVDALADLDRPGAMSQAARVAVAAVLRRRGLPAAAAQAQDVRGLVRAVGQRFNPAFREDQFNVTDV